MSPETTHAYTLQTIFTIKVHFIVSFQTCRTTMSKFPLYHASYLAKAIILFGGISLVAC
jgi:hypothetical protein